MLNNDIRLKEDFLDRLFNAINRDEKIGMAGGKMLQFDEGHIDSAGQFLSKSKRIIDRGYRELDNIRYDIGGFTLGINASCALYRRAMLDDIRENGQYFDEDFEYFYEEMDLALRARRRGWKAYYEPTAVAYHKRGATTKGLRPTPYLLGKYYITHLTTRFQHYALRNRYLMIIKNCPITDILKDLPYILRYEITQALYIIFFKPALLLYILKDIKVFSRTFRKRNDIFSGER
jgi:GT2 family glycosyltransferase